MNLPKPITILGTGLLGTSLAAALRARNYTGNILGLAHRQSTADRAAATGAYNSVTLDPVEVIADAAMIVVAVPLSGFADMFDLITIHAKQNPIVTDVGSTKQTPLADARAHLTGLSRFVGAHPMAGNEQTGPDGADPDLFVGKPCIVCPESDSDPDAVAIVENVWRAVGMNVLRMTAEEHDRQTALTSHLPHAVSSLLALVAAEQGGWDVASTGFTSTTRLASSNPPMRADIMLANRQKLSEAIEAFRDRLDVLFKAIEANDRDRVLTMLNLAKVSRDDWLSKQIGPIATADSKE